jgi:hypothetical protein
MLRRVRARSSTAFFGAASQPADDAYGIARRAERVGATTGRKRT